MRVFLSSVIRGLERFRDAAAKGAITLGHEVKRSEDFPASPDSPQRVCLAEARNSDVTLLILGAAYGQPQGAEQLSATHQEYREARDHKEVLLFIQEGVTRDAPQDTFVREVQGWARGHFTASFSTPDDLQAAVTKGLHDYALARSAGVADESEIKSRAESLLPRQGRGQSPSLVVIVSGGPKQAVLRPAELESPELAKRIIKNASYGSDEIFDLKRATDWRIERDALSIEQDSASILLTPLGDVRIILPGYGERSGRGFSMSVLVEEDIQARITRALRFAATLLDDVDPNRRLQTVVPFVAMLDARYTGWKTRKEQETNPNTVVMGSSLSDAPATALLARISQPRPALSINAQTLAEDFTVLLRRQIRNQ